MSTESTVYYDGYGSYGCPKNVLPIKTLKKVKKKIQQKNCYLENLTTKKMSTGSSVYYDEYGSYGCSKIFF